MSTTENPRTAKQIVAGRQPSTGTLFIATDAGTRIDFPASMVADIAVMLAEFCSDNYRRAFVADEWYELEDEDVVAMNEQLAAPVQSTNADLPTSALYRFPIDPTTDVLVSIVATIS